MQPRRIEALVDAGRAGFSRMGHERERPHGASNGTPAGPPGLAAGPLVRARFRQAHVDRRGRLDRGGARRRSSPPSTRRGPNSRRCWRPARDEEAEAILAFQIALLEDRACRDRHLRGSRRERRPHRRGARRWMRRSRLCRVPRTAISGPARRPAPICAIVCCGRLTGEADRGDARRRHRRRPTICRRRDSWPPTGAAAASCCAAGSPTSHVAILARARGVPMLVGSGRDRMSSGHAEALLDGERGELIVDPGRGHAGRLRAPAGRPGLAPCGRSLHLDRPGRHRRRRAIQVMINIAGPDEIERLDPGDCDGIGLVRTEFLFHGRGRLPDEEEQYQVYRRMLEWAGDKPVTIRTLDAGGDKPIAGSDAARREQSVPGRTRSAAVACGIRRYSAHSCARLPALRSRGNLKIMVPMVTVPAEMTAAARCSTQAMRELASRGRAGDAPPLGMMVEVPAAAIEHRGVRCRFLLDRQQRSDPIPGGGSRDEPELADLAQPSRAVLQLDRRCRRRMAVASAARSACAAISPATPRHVPALSTADCALFRWRRPRWRR